MLIEDVINDDFPYVNKKINLLDSHITYIEQGRGDPIVFLHGVPTSNYLWRNIIPHVATVGHCIAPDLIGFGQSGKPDIDYSISDHLNYFTAFIDALGLKNITLVLHGWGSVIGLAYAMQHADNVKAIACYEAHIRPVMAPELMALPVQHIAAKLENDPELEQKILESNYVIEKLFAATVMRPLTKTELSYYLAPFKTMSDRKPLWKYICELPWNGKCESTVALIKQYADYLQQTNIPKLLMFSVPGFITPIDTVTWTKKHLSHLTMLDLGDALHCAQEINPELMGKAIAVWYQASL